MVHILHARSAAVSWTYLVHTLRWLTEIFLCVLPTPILVCSRPRCHQESVMEAMSSSEVLMGSTLGAHSWLSCMLRTTPRYPIQSWPVLKQYTRWPCWQQLSSHLRFKLSVVNVSMSPPSLCFTMELDHLKLLSEPLEMVEMMKECCTEFKPNIILYKPNIILNWSYFQHLSHLQALSCCQIIKNCVLGY